MPNSKQHLEKATRNGDFLDTINVDKFHDWASVVGFYKAVHLVERLRTLAKKLDDQHSTNHGGRMDYVQRVHRPIHTAYHELYNAAYIARYHTHHQFCNQFECKDVKTRLIDNYLDNIEKYVLSHFPLPAAPATATATDKVVALPVQPKGEKT